MKLLCVQRYSILHRRALACFPSGQTSLKMGACVVEATGSAPAVNGQYVDFETLSIKHVPSSSTGNQPFMKTRLEPHYRGSHRLRHM